VNKLLKGVMLENTPRLSGIVINGTAKGVLAGMPEYLDEFFSSGMRALNPGIDFRYEGYRIVPPHEEYNSIIAKPTTPIKYDLSHSNVYLVEFRFSYNGVLILRPMYLPYADEGNLITVGGSKYHIMPVLSDTVMSPSESGVFMRLLKAKLNFTDKSRYFMVNGVKTVGRVIHGDILKPGKKRIEDRIGRPLTATGLYILGKYGIRETFARYGNVKDIIVTKEDSLVCPDGYIEYGSMGVRPRGLKMVPYIPHKVRLFVKEDGCVRSFVDVMAYSIIYTLDILPDIQDDVIEVYAGNDLCCETSFWRIILGKIIYKNSYSIDRIVQDLEDHYRALENYVDEMLRRKLVEAGIRVDSFFDLLGVMMTNYSNWVLESNEYNSNIENRYIDILYYLTCEIIIGFNRIILTINKRAGKTAAIGHKEVKKIVDNELTTKGVYRLTKSKEPNLAISSVDASSDIMYPKITSDLED